MHSDGWNFKIFSEMFWKIKLWKCKIIPKVVHFWKYKLTASSQKLFETCRHDTGVGLYQTYDCCTDLKSKMATTTE